VNVNVRVKMSRNTYLVNKGAGNMKKKWFYVGISFLLLLLTSCMNNDSEHDGMHQNADGVTLPITMTVEVLPENPTVAKEVTFRAITVKDGESIEGASSVKFEVWKDGQDEHQMLPATYIKNGTYEVTTTFTEDGTYYVIYHINDITGIHHMDQLEFKVGLAGAHHGDSNDHQGHSSNKLLIHNMDLSPKQNEEIIVMTHIAMDGKALAKAKVNFEIIHESTGEKHLVTAAEIKVGEYVGTFTFKATGKYVITTHVEQSNMDIHEHKKWNINVK
jgi:hypothetical protein